MPPIEKSEQPRPSALSRVTLRKLLNKLLITDSSLEEFCLDHFEAVYKQFGKGMDRTSKLNLLLEMNSNEEIYDCLHRHYWEHNPKAFASMLHPERSLGADAESKTQQIDSPGSSEAYTTSVQPSEFKKSTIRSATMWVTIAVVVFSTCFTAYLVDNRHIVSSQRLTDMGSTVVERQDLRGQSDIATDMNNDADPAIDASSPPDAEGNTVPAKGDTPAVGPNRKKTAPQSPTKRYPPLGPSAI